MLRQFLRLPVIIGAVPYPLVNGTLANADEVQADFDWIIAQVNANAQPGGGSITTSVEWTALTDTPTFVSTTSFDVDGDQTATFTIGRRVRATVTAGTVYGTVRAASVVLNTTVTLAMSSGVLDSGLSALAIGTLNAVDQSAPALSNMFIGDVGGNQTAIPTNTVTLAFATPNAAPQGDAVREWSNDSNAKFTPVYAGNYVFEIGGWLFMNGANLLLASTTFQFYLYKNGAHANTMAFSNLVGSTGVNSNRISTAGFGALSLIVGDYVDLRIEGGNWNTANPIWQGFMTIRRLPYPR